MSVQHLDDGHLSADEGTGALLIYLGGHLLIGLLAAALFFILILLFDLFDLRALIFADPDGWLAGLLLFAGLAVSFGPAATAVGIMALERDPRA